MKVDGSGVQVHGDETLRDVARGITDKVRANATIDWTIRESACARLIVVVRRTLNKYGYPAVDVGVLSRRSRTGVDLSLRGKLRISEDIQTLAIVEICLRRFFRTTKRKESA